MLHSRQYGEEKGFSTPPGEGAFYETLCGEAWAQCEAASERTHFQLVAFGLSILGGAPRSPSAWYFSGMPTPSRVSPNTRSHLNSLFQGYPWRKLVSSEIRSQLYGLVHPLAFFFFLPFLIMAAISFTARHSFQEAETTGTITLFTSSWRVCAQLLFSPQLNLNALLGVTHTLV